MNQNIETGERLAGRIPMPVMPISEQLVSAGAAGPFILNLSQEVFHINGNFAIFVFQIIDIGNHLVELFFVLNGLVDFLAVFD